MFVATKEAEKEPNETLYGYYQVRKEDNNKKRVTEKKAETEDSTEVHQEADSETNIEAIAKADMNPEI